MTIKPIDFQVMLPKTQEVAKMRNDELHKNQALQQQQANSVQNKAENNLKQVYSQDKTQESRIREKQEKNQGQKRDNRKKDKSQSDEGKASSPMKKTSTIDIRL